MSSGPNSTSPGSQIDQLSLGIIVIGISFVGFLSNGLATWFVATDPQFRHSTGIICINTTFANFAYSTIYLCFVGPMMIMGLGWSNSEPMTSLSVIIWYLFFVGQYCAFCLSMNRAIAVLFPLSYYQHATVRLTIWLCSFIWIAAIGHLLFFILKICPGVQFNAVQSYLAISSWSDSAKRCVNFLRVNIEMYLLISLSTISLLSDMSCAARVLFSSTIRTKMKASDLQFLYQSLCASVFLCIECVLAGYVVATATITNLTQYFVLTTMNRVLGRAISGILVLVFHRKLRTRIVLTLFSICLSPDQQVTLVQPLRPHPPAERATKESNKSTDTNGSASPFPQRLRSSPI
ncbi:unnamed protein product, partial [Mesorhabditis belari]|uniref:G-protein coupled receptors family 1 profile domain-containing protein n=1 Tax=Mesorhabditis belari TaxID=2138241 RepID=A0AAF3FFK4_9BILA